MDERTSPFLVYLAHEQWFPFSFLPGCSYFLSCSRLLGSRGQRGISRKAYNISGDHSPGLRAIKPNGHRRLERAGIIKACDGNRQQVRSGSEHWRATLRAKLSAYNPRTFRLHAIARGLAMPGDRRCWHDHVVPIGPAGPALAIATVTQGHGNGRSATLVSYASASTTAWCCPVMVPPVFRSLNSPVTQMTFAVSRNPEHLFERADRSKRLTRGVGHAVVTNCHCETRVWVGPANRPPAPGWHSV